LRCGRSDIVKNGTSAIRGPTRPEREDAPVLGRVGGNSKLKTQNSKLMFYWSLEVDQAAVSPDSKPSVKMGDGTLILTIVSAECDDASLAR